MKIIIILIGLVLLSGCNKSDWFGYTSYNHCFVEKMGHKTPTPYMQGRVSQYCKEKFPDNGALSTEEKP